MSGENKDLLDSVADERPPRSVCPSCRHTQAMHDFVKVEPAAPTCSCVHPFHMKPKGPEKAESEDIFDEDEEDRALMTSRGGRRHIRKRWYERGQDALVAENRQLRAALEQIDDCECGASRTENRGHTDGCLVGQALTPPQEGEETDG